MRKPICNKCGTAITPFNSNYFDSRGLCYECQDADETNNKIERSIKLWNYIKELPESEKSITDIEIQEIIDAYYIGSKQGVFHTK